MSITRKQKRIIAALSIMALCVTGGIAIAQVFTSMYGSWTWSKYSMPVQFAYAVDSEEMQIVIDSTLLEFTGVFPYLSGMEITMEQIVAIELLTGYQPATMTFDGITPIGNTGGAGRQYRFTLYLVNSTHETQVILYDQNPTGEWLGRVSAPVTTVLYETSYLKGVLWTGGELGNPSLLPLSFRIDVSLQPTPI